MPLIADDSLLFYFYFTFISLLYHFYFTFILLLFHFYFTFIFLSKFDNVTSSDRCYFTFIVLKIDAVVISFVSCVRGSSRYYLMMFYNVEYEEWVERGVSFFSECKKWLNVFFLFFYLSCLFHSSNIFFFNIDFFYLFFFNFSPFFLHFFP